MPFNFDMVCIHTDIYKRGGIAMRFSYKIRSISMLIAFLAVGGVMAWTYGRSAWRAEKAIGRLVGQIEQGRVNDITLTIYYALPASSWFPVSIDSLVNHRPHYKIVVDGAQLEEYLDEISRLGYVSLTSVRRRTAIDAGIYYVFKDSYNREILSVAMFGSGGNENVFGGASVFVNGAEVEWNAVFIELILPFLPESRAEIWERNFERWND